MVCDGYRSFIEIADVFQNINDLEIEAKVVFT
jgi:hypothetical protein